MDKKKKSWNELTWNEKKDRFKEIVFIFLFLSVFTFFSTPHPNITELETIDIKITKEPGFEKSKGKSTSYWIELHSGEKTYEISGVDYKYLSKNKFSELVHKDSTITISKLGDKIFKMKFKNEELLNYNLAGIHKMKNRNFMRIIFFSGFFLCLIPFFFKNPPDIKGKTKLILGTFILVCWVISIIVALIYLENIKYISSSEPFN